LFEQRPRLHDAGLRRRIVRRALVDSGLGDVAVADKLLASLQLQLRVDGRRLRLFKIGSLLVDGRLIGILLDAKQQVTFLHLLALDEITLLDESGDARDNIDLVDRRDTSDVSSGFCDLAAHYRCHGYRGWGRSRLSASDAAASDKDERRNGHALAESSGQAAVDQNDSLDGRVHRG